MSSSIEFDREHIWHPYASVTDPIPPLEVSSASGAVLTLSDGAEMIDAMASWWAVIHGYNHPRLNQAATDQLAKMSHVMFGGLTHRPAIELCRKLVAITPKGLNKVFLSDSGSVAVDIALKMAMQYWQETNHPNKSKFVALRGGYHGDTLGAMSVCDPVTGMHQLFRDNLAQQYFVDKPQAVFGEAANQQQIAKLKALFENHHHELAAMIVEPIVQGAGGMHFYSADYLKQIADLCRHYNILLIADEIATGFGRAGKLFACEFADISPDIMCVGKALTGGYITLAATLCSDEVARGICDGESGALMHGPTFMANPLACNIACASIDLLVNSNWRKNIQRIEQQFKRGLAGGIDHSNVTDLRILGAMAVVETDKPVDMRKVQKKLPSLGVWLRPFGKLIYSLPPYIISNEQIKQVTHAMLSVAEDCT